MTPKDQGRRYWETALAILVVEPDESNSRQVGIIAAWFQTTTPFTIKDNNDNEVFLGDTKLTRRSFRLS